MGDVCSRASKLIIQFYVSFLFISSVLYLNSYEIIDYHAKRNTIFLSQKVNLNCVLKTFFNCIFLIFQSNTKIRSVKRVCISYQDWLVLVNEWCIEYCMAVLQIFIKYQVYLIYRNTNILLHYLSIWHEHKVKT